MRYFVALVGGAIVLFGVLVVTMIAWTSLTPKSIPAVVGAVVAWVLGGLAAASSIRATLRHYRLQDQRADSD
ncbi:MAG TPA: hypothetical protein VHR72_09575 [Gemmataceae bacterium]|jgi:hypothetical protein|nr:hypothetical protein [Gemmataceae bacterium]